MIKQELVTIYIPCRNYGNYLNQSIESVINQLYSNWELFLVDENSSDNTLDIFNRFKVKYPDKITVIKNLKPQGLQKIANSILKLSRGKYMIRLDADDWLDESALLILVSKIQSDDSVGLVFGNF
uniref:glycosyltransferase family 2 protein n=1 Tax=Flavobacterium sp. TaxID=239 RepID=UPI00404A1832